MELISFLLFVTIVTSIFFLPNSVALFSIIVFGNICLIIIFKISLKKIIKKIKKIIPYIILNFLINIVISNISDACWIMFKFFIVCIITYTYSSINTATSITNIIKKLCKPLALFNVNLEEIESVLLISWSVIEVLKRELLDMKNVYTSKNLKVNIRNIKHSMGVYFIGIIKRTEQMDEALISKGKNF